VFPVVSWTTFVDYIRTRVNILATEEHLRELVNQLHFIGEVSLSPYSAVQDNVSDVTVVSEYF